MKNKIALVTGGTGGIGTAICRHLAARGAKVIASYHRGGDHASAKLWQDEQFKNDHNISIFYMDVMDFSSCQTVIQNMEQEFGSIDILVNNAGIARDVPLYKMDPAQWRSVLQTNLDGVFNVTRNVICSMMERGYGRIVNISSINGQKGQFGQTNYSASKAGIHGFTKSLAQEVAHKGITVNTISPGYIDTPMLMSVNEEIRKKIMSQIPVGRFGKPEEVAWAVGFLAGESSGFITGSNLTINGGQYLI